MLTYTNASVFANQNAHAHTVVFNSFQIMFSINQIIQLYSRFVKGSTLVLMCSVNITFLTCLFPLNYTLLIHSVLCVFFSLPNLSFELVYC